MSDPTHQPCTESKNSRRPITARSAGTALVVLIALAASVSSGLGVTGAASAFGTLRSIFHTGDGGDRDATPESGNGRVTLHKRHQAWQGLTLFNHKDRNSAIVIDMDGREVLSFQPLPDGEFSLVGPIRPQVNRQFIFTVHHPPTKGRIPTVGKLWKTDAAGKILREWDGGAPLCNLHHDLVELENGHVLAIVSPSRCQIFPGLGPRPIQDDRIIEINSEGDVVWSWSTVEHFDQLPLTDNERRIIRDTNWESKGNTEWGDSIFNFHTNSLQPLPANRHEQTHSEFAAGNLLISQRRTDLVFIIDRQTGDIVWSSTIEHVGQHTPRMIPYGLPGAGNILIYDNGDNGRQAVVPQKRGYSRILEIEPVSQQVVWSYDATMSGQARSDFCSPNRGSAQRLPNGNTLIVEAGGIRLFEVTSAGEIAWEYTVNSKGGGYRALRMHKDWISGGSPDLVRVEQQ